MHVFVWERASVRPLAAAGGERGVPCCALAPAIAADLRLIAQRTQSSSDLGNSSRPHASFQPLPSGSWSTAPRQPGHVWQEEGEGANSSGRRQQRVRPSAAGASLPHASLPSQLHSCPAYSQFALRPCCRSEQAKPCCSGKAAADAKQQGAAAPAAASSQQKEEAVISSFMFGG